MKKTLSVIRMNCMGGNLMALIDYKKNNNFKFFEFLVNQIDKRGEQWELFFVDWAMSFSGFTCWEELFIFVSVTHGEENCLVVSTNGNQMHFIHTNIN